MLALFINFLNNFLERKSKSKSHIYNYAHSYNATIILLKSCHYMGPMLGIYLFICESFMGFFTWEISQSENPLLKFHTGSLHIENIRQNSNFGSKETHELFLIRYEQTLYQSVTDVYRLCLNFIEQCKIILRIRPIA